MAFNSSLLILSRFGHEKPHTDRKMRTASQLLKKATPQNQAQSVIAGKRGKKTTNSFDLAAFIESKPAHLSKCTNHDEFEPQEVRSESHQQNNKYYTGKVSKSLFRCFDVNQTEFQKIHIKNGNACRFVFFVNRIFLAVISK
ncbi:hypothetical protein [Planctobacterium marinum]|uniref:hypothetical protein n=1 Tax=Planctobacterium marinum TaxID=1631968 RepID=UPI0030C750EB